jgi:hypothetical protein
MVVGTNSSTFAAIKDEITQCYTDKVGIKVADNLGPISYGKSNSNKYMLPKHFRRVIY